MKSLYDQVCFQVMAHADWLLRGPEKSELPSCRALCEDNAHFQGLVSSGGKIAKLVLMKIKRD